MEKQNWRALDKVEEKVAKMIKDLKDITKKQVLFLSSPKKVLV